MDEENDVKPVSEVVPARANLVWRKKNNAEVCRVKNPRSYYWTTFCVVCCLGRNARQGGGMSLTFSSRTE